VVIAAITSCTNTSNPNVLIGAGLLARKARQRGLMTKPWVKTSLAPGSQVVSDYLEAAKLQDDLDALGFNLVGYGCTTCIGNSGPLPEPIANAVDQNELIVCSVLSGNRNFEGRINPHTRANYLASPPLCVVYALTGTMLTDVRKDPIGTDDAGNPVYLNEIWPTNQEIEEIIRQTLNPEMFRRRYSNVFFGPEQWNTLKTSTGMTYAWEEHSTYVKLPPLFQYMDKTAGQLNDIKDARLLVILGDSVTTDHISPAGAIKKQSPAGSYLMSHDVKPLDFNSYGSRRGNHEVMIRGTFANIRLRNALVPGIEGGETRHFPSGEQMSIYDAAMRYMDEKVPLIIIAGKEYGTGSSRDWAAKGTYLLGIRGVIAESFERIHRSNLIGMGVLPLQFKDGMTYSSLELDHTETFDILGIEDDLKPRMELTLVVHRSDGRSDRFALLCRIDTLDEIAYYKHGGILQYVLRSIIKEAA
jgi:aconitate hydratase